MRRLPPAGSESVVDIQGRTTGLVQVQGRSNVHLRSGSHVDVGGHANVLVNSRSVVNAHQALAEGHSIVHTGAQSLVDVHGHGSVHVEHGENVVVPKGGHVLAMGGLVNVGKDSSVHVHGFDASVQVHKR